MNNEKSKMSNPTSNIQIMIVEDERVIALDIEESLKGLGYSVSSIVASGERAIKNAEENKPDLILMDIVLKGEMDGIEAARIIRSRFHIPLIYITAYANEETLAKAKMTEPYGYMIKPFQTRELHVSIEMALFKHKVEKERRQAEAERKKLVLELQEALGKVKLLSGLLPVCANCKDIRNDEGYWEQIEGYISDHSEADFSHGICPKCAKKLYPEIYEG